MIPAQPRPPLRFSGTASVGWRGILASSMAAAATATAARIADAAKPAW
jgi:hypothetical protein